MAGQDVQGMLIRIEATTAQLRQEMDKADASVTKATGRIDDQLSRVDSAFDRVGKSAQSTANVLKGALALAIGGTGTGALIAQAEAYTQVANRLKLVTSSAQEFTAAQNAIFSTAQKSGQPLGATAELYQRIAQNQDALKLSGKGVAGIVETISKTMVISGASAESAKAALIQLGQAFASGTLRGEELNSVMEQAPALSQAIAKGMGVSVGALRALGADGKLTAESVVQALQAQAGAVDALFGKMQDTIGTALTRVQTSFTKIIGQADTFGGASTSLASAINSVSKALDGVNVPAAMAVLEEHGRTIATVFGVVLVAALGRVVASLAEAGAKAVGNIATWIELTAVTRAAALATIEQTTASAALATAHASEAASSVLVARATEAGAIAKFRLIQGQRDQLAYTAALAVGTAEEMLYTKALAATDIELAAAKRVAQVSSVQLGTALNIESAAMAKDAAATEAATLAKAEYAAISSTMARAGSALLGVLGGPVGLLFTVGALAASYLMFSDNTDIATKALIDQNLTIDESIKKFQDLSAEQQRLQVSKWGEAQRSQLDAASSALSDYAARGADAFHTLGASGVQSGETFTRMVAEVKSGARSLDSVTEWVAKNNQILPSFKSLLEQTAAAYSGNSKEADKYGKMLGQIGSVTTNVTSNTEKLTAAQKGSGQTDASKAAWDKYIEQLTKTRDLVGANAAAEAAWNAEKMGAGPEQKAQAKVISDQIDTLKKYQDAIKEGDKVQQASLKLQLVALYTAEDAAITAAATQRKALDDTAKAAEDSAGRQVNAMQTVIDQTLRVVNGQNLLLVQPKKQNLTGYSLLTNGGTAPVVPVAPKATPDQRAATAIAQLDATTEANKRVDKAANAAATAIKNQEKALADLLAKSGISTKASNDIADAYLAGANNVRELTIRQEIEQEVLKTGAKSYDEVKAAVNALHDAKDREDVMKNVAELKVEVDQILEQATATLHGKDALEAYNIQKSVAVALAGKNIAVGSEEYKQLIKQTEAQLAANKALEGAGRVEGIVDRLSPEIKLLRDYKEAQQDLTDAMKTAPENAALYQDALVKLGYEYEVNRSKATLWGQMTEGAIDRIDEAFASAWGNIGSGAESLWDNLKKGFKQTLGEIAHMLTTKPLLASISNWLTGTDNGQGLSSVWSKLLGSVSGSPSSSGSTSAFGGLANVGQNLLSAWNTVTGVGSSVASGYASGGVSGAISGGASYYGNMLSNISSMLSKGFTSLVSTITGTAAVQTAATIGAQGVTSAVLSGAVTEGATAIGAQFTTGVATTTAATYAAAEAGAAATAASLGGQISAAMSSAAAMWPLAIIMGMYQSGKLYSAGVRPDAGEMWDSAGSTALGKVTMLPQTLAAKYFEVTDGLLGKVVGGKMAAILSGSTLFQAVWSKVGSKLFGSGYQTKDTGIELGVSGGMFDAQQYTKQKKKGGWLSGSSKTRYLYNALDAETEDALGAAYNEKILNSMGLFSALGVQLSDSVLDGLNVAATRISTQGKTPEAIQAELDTWFTSLGDSAVSAINLATASGLENYNFETLTTFVNNLYSVNGSFEMLNLKLYDVSVSTGFMAEQLIAMAGGMEAFNTANSTFFDNFYTDAEKADYALLTVNRQFAAMGVTLPGTRDAYRDMVEALDKTTESGRQMYVTLTSMSASAGQAYSILEQRADAAAAAMKALGDALMGSVANAMSAIQRAVSAEKDAATKAYNARTTSLNDMVSTATENVSGLTSVGNELGAALKALRGESDDAVKMLRAQAQATLQSALAAARSGGSLSGITGLSDALDAVSTNTTDLYSTLEDFNREQGRTANVVAELSGLGGNQLTAAEQTVKTLQDQLDQAKQSYDEQMAQFDQQESFAQAQLDALNGIDTSVKTVNDAVAAMNASVVAALSMMADGAAKTNTSTNNTALVDALYKVILGRSADSAGAAYWQGQLQSGALDYDQIAVAIANAAKVNALETNASKDSAASYLGSTVESSYQSILGRSADAAGMAYWAGQLQSGAISIGQLNQALANAARENGQAVIAPGYATGGRISGPGTGTSDSILSRLSNGEYVMRAAAVSTYGTGLLDQMNALQLPAFAAGGAIGESGPQLEVTGPSRIYSANQSGSAANGGNNANLVVELRAIRAELESVKANTQAGALNGGKLVRTLDRVTDGGNAMQTKAAS